MNRAMLVWAIAPLILGSLAGCAGGLLPYEFPTVVRAATMAYSGQSLVMATKVDKAPTATAASPAPLPLPDTSIAPFGVSATADPTLLDKTYATAEFSLQYPATWYPQEILPSSAAHGMVLALGPESNRAFFFVSSQLADKPLGTFLAIAEANFGQGMKTVSSTTLAGEQGFEIDGMFYQHGKEYSESRIGLPHQSRYYELILLEETGDKDKDLVPKQIASMLPTWKWR